MRNRIIALLCSIMLFTTGLPALAAGGSNEEFPKRELTWKQVLERQQPDTSMVAVDRNGEKRFEAKWLSDHLKVDLPEKAHDWVTLWAGPQQSVSYRPVGATGAPGKALGSSMRYTRAWDGADLTAQVGPGLYKETIVLSAPPAKNIWTFEVKTENLTAVQSEGEIHFTFGATPMMRVSGLVATDARGQTVPVLANLRSTGDKNFIDLTVDADWLAKAAYPVEVDPTTIGPIGGALNATASSITQLPSGTLVASVGTRIYVSTNTGNTWSQIATLPNGYDRACITSDNSNNFYVVYSGLNWPWVRWRLLKFTSSGTNSWSMGSPQDLTYDMLNSYGCAAAYDSKQNNVIVAYSYLGTSGYPSEYQWRYYRVASNSLSGNYSLEYYPSGQTPFNVNILTNSANGSLYFTWRTLTLTGTAVRTYTTSDGWNYYGQYSNNLGPSEYSSAALNSAGNVVVANYSNGVLSAVTYSPTSNTFTTQTLESTNLGSDRPALTNVGGDLYLYWRAPDNAIYYRKYNNATSIWQPKALVQAGNLANPNAAASYRTTDAAFVMWQDNATSTTVIGGVVPPKAPNAPTNLSPAANSWVGSLTPQLTWTYSNTNPADPQGAYQVQVKSSAGTVIHDSGKISSNGASYVVPPGVLAAGNTYSWAVRSWDAQGDMAGPWSIWAVFGVDQTAPVVTVSVSGGTTYTKSTGVSLNITAQDVPSGPSMMRFVYKGITTAWQAYSTSAPFTLSTPDGLQTVKVEVSDRAGNIGSAEATITLDTTAPTVSISSPASGTITGGIVTVGANATDNTALKEVRFYQGTTQIGTATAAPWKTDWDTNSVVNDIYSLTAVAYDQAGNTATSATISLTVDNHPPTVALTVPTNGDSIRGVYTLQVSASDRVGISKVEYYVDNVLVGTATSAPYSLGWNTASATNSSHTIVAKAYNGYGNTAASGSANVTVNNAAVTGSLAVAPGGTSGPGGTLQLTVNSGAASWYGVEYRTTPSGPWLTQVGSGTLTAGAATVPWVVPITAAAYEVRVGLIDAQGNAGYTSTKGFTLPAQPALSITTHSRGGIRADWSGGNGSQYELVYSLDGSFSDGTTEIVATSSNSFVESEFNGVANGSFEITAGPLGSQTAARWVTTGGASQTVVQGGPMGQRSMEVKATAPSIAAGVQQVVYEGTGLVGKPLTATAQVRLDALSGTGFALRLRLTRRDGTVVSSCDARLTSPTSGYQTLQTSCVVPAETYRVIVEFVFLSSTGTARVDGAQVYGWGTRSTYHAGLPFAPAYYRLRSWNGPLYTDSAPIRRATEPFPKAFGRWGWAL